MSSMRTVSALLRWQIVLICLAAVPLISQIRDLATTDDGGVLYFSTTLRLKGSSQFQNEKIFRYADGVFELVAQVEPVVTLSDGSTFKFNYRLPTVSGDGRVLAYDGTASCFGGALCFGAFTARGFITGATLPSPMTFYGSLRVSHSGRFVLRFGGNPSLVSPPALALYDSETGEVINVPSVSAAGDGRQSIADDGTVITASALWRAGQWRAVIWQGTPVTARISANGGAVVYEMAVMRTRSGSGGFYISNFSNTLYATDLSTGNEVNFGQSPIYSVGGPEAKGQAYFHPSISNDGRRILYRWRDEEAPPQAMISNIDGTGRRVLTAEESGIAEAVLSGDGRRAYAATGGGGLISIDVDSGIVHRILPEAPFITDQPFSIVPGSAFQLPGRSLAADGRPNITIAGLEPAVILSNPEANWTMFQAPWELDTGAPITIVAADPASPFEQTISVQPDMARPVPLQVLHQDFRGEVTTDDPARIGEIVVLYMAGLGPVRPAIQNGEPASLDTLSYLEFPLTCWWRNPAGDVPADISFAGLAPGLIGIYQVNVRVDSYERLECASRLPSGELSKGAILFIKTARN